eukprot:scaffold13488_cov57-Phaeocystis_antarctica.AAC.1
MSPGPFVHRSAASIAPSVFPLSGGAVSSGCGAIRRLFRDFTFRGITSETTPRRAARAAAFGRNGKRSARLRRDRTTAHVAMVPTSKSELTKPPTPATTTTIGAAESGMSVPRARGALAGGRLGGVRGDGG